MEYFIHYSLYLIGAVAVLVPIMAFGVFAPTIVQTTVVAFVANGFAQLTDLKFFEELQKKFGGKDHVDEDHAPMWELVEDEAHEGEVPHEHHVIPIKTYLFVLLALFVGTFITVLVAKTTDFGRWNMLIAMVIASVKAFFVLAYFMHLKYDNLLNRVIFLSAFFFLMLLFGFSFGDILSRIGVDKAFK